jgi:outer membrane murein-binding lipoprotein Lpp
MKSLRIMKLAAATMAIAMLAGCGSTRRVVKDTPNAQGVMQKQEFLQKVSDNAQHARFVTSKVKFSVEVGSQQLTLTGNLKMKRDDVIRLQLMAFGFVEAARLEFTQNYVLVMDRINKQYLRVPYQQLDFLRNSGLDFYALQALFWNELFQPGKTHITDEMLKSYTTDMEGEDAVISMESGKLSYRWLAEKGSALVKMANILYKDRYRGNYQLNWDYLDFKINGRKKFPMDHKVKFSTPDKEVKFEMMLNYLGADEDWEPRTEVSSKYRQVSVDEILRRFMAL